jgi:hypothetical protein
VLERKPFLPHRNVDSTYLIMLRIPYVEDGETTFFAGAKLIFDFLSLEIQVLNLL